MNHFEELLEDTLYLEIPAARIYFNGYFKIENEEDYEFDERMSEANIRALRYLFESEDELEARVDEALEIDPLCLEAWYICHKLSEDEENHHLLRRYLALSKEYPGFNEYEKDNYRFILMRHADYLAAIHNVHKALSVLDLLSGLEGSRQGLVEMYALCYATLERGEEFYQLYLDTEFTSLFQYLMLIVTLLKEESFQRAEEVCRDMIEVYPLSVFLDHPQDLADDESKETETFFNTLDFVYDHLLSVEDFFLWFKETKKTARYS
ncbi:MAG: hypothetical protein IJJ30_01955 [Erysipelotrichaceae bacterium]|nr:hypothetical protein [Erysipelotrichaceae bacterium]